MPNTIMEFERITNSPPPCLLTTSTVTRHSPAGSKGQAKPARKGQAALQEDLEDWNPQPRSTFRLQSHSLAHLAKQTEASISTAAALQNLPAEEISYVSFRKRLNTTILHMPCVPAK